MILPAPHRYFSELAVADMWLVADVHADSGEVSAHRLDLRLEALPREHRVWSGIELGLVGCPKHLGPVAVAGGAQGFEPCLDVVRGCQHFVANRQIVEKGLRLILAHPAETGL
jgi:hypothetical protein